MIALVLICSILTAVIPGLNPERDNVDTLLVHFRQNKASYEASYLGNGQTVASLATLVENIGQDNLQSIEIVGYASPEGVRERNLYLSRERAASTKKALRSALPAWAMERASTSIGGESWELFRSRVEQDTTMSAKTRMRVLAILDATDINAGTKKWRLENILGLDPNAGNMYRYIMNSHYRYIRGSMIVVRYKADGGSGKADGAGDSGTGAGDSAGDKLQGDTGSEGPAEPTEPEDGPTEPSGQESPAEPEGPESIKVQPDKRPILGIGTNLIYDATYIPNYGFTSIPSFNVEFYPAGPTHYSFGGNVEWPMWRHRDTHKYMQIQNVGLWARRYFKPQEGHFEGLYLSAGANAYRYGIGWDAKGWEGEGLGASVGIGYKKMIGRSRWWFDTGIDLGGLVSKYDPYVYGFDATGWYYYDYAGKPEDFKQRQHLMLWFGPTRAYFSIGMDIFNRKKR